ncbi:hypothetical protein BH11BAC7_BH11BAC7_34610 [soil metagenome]
MKTLFTPLFALLLLAGFLTGCDKADMKIKQLYHGDGTWTIKSLHYEDYDSTGYYVVSDSTITEPGEFMFFKTTTLDGLFEYHFAVIMLKLPNGASHEYPCGVYFDGSRAHVEANVYPDYVPPEYLAVWSITKSGRRNQEWTKFTMRADGSLARKVTMVLKFK